MSASAATAGSAGEPLAAIAMEQGSDSQLRAELDTVCELAAAIAEASAASLQIDDPRADEPVASYSEPGAATGPDAGWTQATQLVSSEGRSLGTLIVSAERRRELTHRQSRALALLSARAVAALEAGQDAVARAAELAAARSEIARAQDRLAAFAGQISHDLKAPITAILGFTELLEDTDAIAADDSASAYVGRCASAARRMLGMVEDMLAFSRVGATLDRSAVELDSVMPEVLAELGSVSVGSLAEAVGRAQVTWSGPAVTADRAQLRALLRNVVHNAVLYRGDGPCHVEVRAERRDAATVLLVIDNGPGVPPQSREEVLRPLARLRKDVPGAGLGLAVCARVMAAHGGALRIEGATGGSATGAPTGTTVVATFPDSPQ